MLMNKKRIKYQNAVKEKTRCKKWNKKIPRKVGFETVSEDANDFNIQWSADSELSFLRVELDIVT